MKVGDLVRKVGGSPHTSHAGVPLKCFGIVVVETADPLSRRAFTRVDFGDYGVFWMLPHEIELLS